MSLVSPSVRDSEKAWIAGRNIRDPGGPGLPAIFLTLSWSATQSPGPQSNASLLPRLQHQRTRELVDEVREDTPTGAQSREEAGADGDIKLNYSKDRSVERSSKAVYAVYFPVVQHDQGTLDSEHPVAGEVFPHDDL